jgi:hypothetical protein
VTVDVEPQLLAEHEGRERDRRPLDGVGGVLRIDAAVDL